jgi:hypothetical protein
MTRIEVRVDASDGSVEVLVAMGGVVPHVSPVEIAATLAQHPVIALAAARRALSRRVEAELARDGERPCD